MPNRYIRKNGSKRGQWDPVQMTEAVRRVKSKELSFREAAKNYNVPVGTLHRRVQSGSDKYAFGPSCCLGTENERKLAAHLKKLCDLGFPLNMIKVRQVAYLYAERLKIPHKFDKTTKMAGYPWFSAFMRRNPELSIRQSEGLSTARAQALTRDIVQKFYDLLEKEIEHYQLWDKPQNIQNVDESGIQLINSVGKVVAAKGAKAVNQLTTGERGETITLVACCSAEGYFLPPVIILKGKNLKAEFQDGLPPGSKVYMNQKSAYINTSLFLRWFKEEYLPRKPVGRNILIVDGHCSHCSSVELLECAEENGVSLLCLPSHSTHALQPLDRTFFAPFKAHFKAETNSWVRQNIGRRVSRYQMGPLVREAWNKSATVGTGTSGFSATGIFPFNRNAVPEHFFAVSDATRNHGFNLEEPGEQLFEEPQAEEPQLEEPQPEEEIHSKKLNATGIEDLNDPLEGKEDRERESPRICLAEISPIPILSAAKRTRRSRNDAMILTSESNRNVVREKVMQKKKAEEKKEQAQIKKSKKAQKNNTPIVKRKLSLQKTDDENTAPDDDSNDKDYIPRHQQPRKKTNKKDTAAKTEHARTIGRRSVKSGTEVIAIESCVECKTSIQEEDGKNVLRCNNCKKWLHATCSIFDSSCIDCGRKS